MDTLRLISEFYALRISKKYTGILVWINVPIEKNSFLLIESSWTESRRKTIMKCFKCNSNVKLLYLNKKVSTNILNQMKNAYFKGIFKWLSGIKFAILYYMFCMQ
jgi:hypothetical protein